MVWRASVPAPRDAANLKELAAREAALARAERIAHVGGWEVDLAANRLTYSDEALRIHGLTREQFDGTLAGAIDLAHPDDRLELTRAIHATLYEGKSFSIDYRIVRPDGSVRHVHVEDEVVRDAAGTPVRAFGITRDITERKAIEADIAERKELQQALREREHTLQAIIDSALDAIVTIDRDGRIVEFNPAAEAIFGYPRSAAVGAPMAERIIPPRLRPAHHEGLERRLAGGAARIAGKRTETHAMRADGTEFPVELVIAPLAAHGVLHFAAFVRDITERKLADQALREERNRLGLVTDNVPAMIAYIDAQCRYQYANLRYRLFYGGSDAAIEGKPLAQVLTPESWELARPNVERALGGETVSTTGERRLHDGSARHISVSLVPHRSDSGAVLGIYVLSLDITEQKRAEDRIRRLNRVYAVLSGINSAIVRIRDRTELLEEACRIAEEAGGFVIAWAGTVEREARLVRPAAWAGANARGYLDTVPRSVFEARPDAPGLLGPALLERKAVISNDVAGDPRLLLTRKECAERGVHSLAVLPIVLEDETVGVLALLAAETGFFDEQEMVLLRELASDISFAFDYIAKSEKVNYLAYYDGVTGLANPALLLDRTGQYLSHAALQNEGAALLLMDVQRFRNVNDTLGRHASDEVLRMIARRLATCAGDESSPARVGPDVFAFIAKNVASEREAMQVATQAIKACFGAPFVIGGNELRLAGRMGIALFPADAADAHALYHHAEVALAKARKQGEECLSYSRDMTGRVAEKLALESRLRHALEAGEFVLHYQPKISARTGAITSVEALIRWANPAGTLVPPKEFVPLLEETGLILPVGEWALHEAVRQYRTWRAQGLAAPRIAVNVSALQLHSKDFVRVLRSAVGAAPHGEHGLDLEITESVIMSNIEDNIDKLTTARRMGMRIFIDDFGTGHSSLRYIARLPLDALKIDRSFVDAMTTSPEDMTIVSSILALGRDLNLKVIAEGVETDDQAKLLRLLKSDEMQGFLFSRPLSADAMASQLRHPQPAPKVGANPRS